jgi:hypothetical protein
MPAKHVARPSETACAGGLLPRLSYSHLISDLLGSGSVPIAGPSIARADDERAQHGQGLQREEQPSFVLAPGDEGGEAAQAGRRRRVCQVGHWGGGTGLGLDLNLDLVWSSLVWANWIVSGQPGGGPSWWVDGWRVVSYGGDSGGGDRRGSDLLAPLKSPKALSRRRRQARFAASRPLKRGGFREVGVTA